METRVAHVVPSMDIGGVEVALSRAMPALKESFDYRVYYVRSRGRLDVGQEPAFKLIGNIITRRWRPDVVVTSLWWSHLVGMVAGFLGCTWVAFFHSPGHPRKLGALLLRTFWRQAPYAFADSAATARGMGPRAGPVHIIPHVFEQSGTIVPWRGRRYDFVWSGRVSSAKRLDLFLLFLREVHKRDTSARVALLLAGTPSSVLLEQLNATKVDLDIRVNAAPAQALEIYATSKFVVLTSDEEGFSMSTFEAVQSGCIPVVRPVGELPRYLSSSCAIFIHSAHEESIAEAASRACQIKVRVDEGEAHSLENIKRLSTYPKYVTTLTTHIMEIAHG